MGQYWKCVTKNKKDGEKVWGLQIVKPDGLTQNDKEYWDYYNGIKLMEHSWVGNSFMTAISKYIYKNITQVAWVGDYADGYEWNYGHKSISPKTLWAKAWDNGKPDEVIEPTEFDLHNKFLVNHTRKIAIDLNDYIDNCTRNGWCIHPLSLLTACGNELGGGDFNTRCVGGNIVDWWCWDRISIEDECPKDCCVEEIEFMEI